MRYKAYERLIVNVDPEPEMTPGGLYTVKTTTGMENTLRGRVVDSPKTLIVDGAVQTWDSGPLYGKTILFINGGSFHEGNTYFVKPENVLAIFDEQA